MLCAITLIPQNADVLWRENYACPQNADVTSAAIWQGNHKLISIPLDGGLHLLIYPVQRQTIFNTQSVQW
jgi:hypothetical protein